jgi:hypothetical protein
MKLCKVCGELKSEDSFYASVYSCMACHRDRAKKSQSKRYGTPEWIAYSKERYQRHRDKARAWSAVRIALLKGELIKPSQCSECSEDLPLEAHHKDYSKPLEILWLCDTCHKHTHGHIKDRGLLRNVEL